MTIYMLAQACVHSHAPPVIITSLRCSGFGKPKPITTMGGWEATHVGRRWTLAADGMPSNTFWYQLSLSKSVDIVNRKQMIYFKGDYDTTGVTSMYMDITNVEEADADILHYTMAYRLTWGFDILVREVDTVFLEVHTKFVTFVHPNEVMFELNDELGHTLYHYVHRAYPNGKTITAAMIRTFAKGYFIRIGEFTRSTRLILTQKRLGLPSCHFINVWLPGNKVLWNPRRVIKRGQPNLDDYWARRVRARHGE